MKIRIPRVESKNKDNVQRRDTEPGDWIDASRRMSVWSLPEDPHERRRIRNAARYRTFRKPAPAGFIFIIADGVTFRFDMTEPLLSEARRRPGLHA
jgi:hypothetical protein